MSEIAPAKNYRRLFRQPDSAFWLDLLQAAPGVTPADQLRRERLTRYALGGALVLTLPYIVLSLFLAPYETRHIVFLNLAGVIAYACGMWAASLGAMPTARTLLMTTLTAQLATLVWLTGPVLGVSVFAFVAAALGRVLFAPHEKTLRLFFVGLSLLILVGGFVVGDRSYIDFSSIPSGVLAFSYILLVLGVFDKEVLRSEAGLVAERDRSNRLLHVILPPKAAETLQHSNAMIAGVIGTVRFSYDVWGDTVNTASRMESHGEPGRIHVTAETMSRLATDFDLEKRGNIDIKGKGTMETWWLLGEKH